WIRRDRSTLAILGYTRAVHCETQRTSASPFSTSGLDSRTRSTRLFAFVALFERRPRTRVRLLAIARARPPPRHDRSSHAGRPKPRIGRSSKNSTQGRLLYEATRGRTQAGYCAKVRLSAFVTDWV